MKNSQRKIGKGLVALLIVTAVIAVLFALSFLVYALIVKNAGDADLYSFGGVIKYHLKGILSLFTFSYGGSKLVYFALSAFLYALIFCWLVFLIAGIIINDKKHRKVMWWAILLTFIDLGVYVVLASGSQKFWGFINQSNANATIMFLVLAIIGFGALFFLLSLLAYFWCIVDCFLSALGYKEEDEYVPYEEIIRTVREQESAPIDDERIRQIAREELIKLQPFKVIIVGNEVVKQEEPKEEPQPVVVEPAPIKEEVVEQPKEEKKPEPKKVIFGKIDFWKVARTVWPQLDNPKPLPKKEEPVVAPAPIENEEEADGLDGFNRKARLPFMMRILKAESETKVNYNILKNEILSYGVKSRLSKTGDVFRLHGKKYAKIFLVGKTLKVYLALNPEDYKDSTIPVEDVGHRPAYAEIPLLFKVRSDLSVRRCKEMIRSAMEKDGLAQKEVKDTNWVSELRKLNAEKAKEKKQ